MVRIVDEHLKLSRFHDPFARRRKKIATIVERRRDRRSLYLLFVYVACITHPLYVRNLGVSERIFFFFLLIPARRDEFHHVRLQSGAIPAQYKSDSSQNRRGYNRDEGGLRGLVEHLERGGAESGHQRDHNSARGGLEVHLEEGRAEQGATRMVSKAAHTDRNEVCHRRDRFCKYIPNICQPVPARVNPGCVKTRQ